MGTIIEYILIVLLVIIGGATLLAILTREDE